MRENRGKEENGGRSERKKKSNLPGPICPTHPQKTGWSHYDCLPEIPAANPERKERIGARSERRTLSILSPLRQYRTRTRGSIYLITCTPTGSGPWERPSSFQETSRERKRDKICDAAGMRTRDLRHGWLAPLQERDVCRHMKYVAMINTDSVFRKTP